jgi:hypothetical protein
MSANVPAQPPASAPPALRDLWHWVQEFGFSDDVERESALEEASYEELTQLVQVVDRQAFDLINSYLDETDNAEEAVPYGDLAQAAMEASLLLKHRGP